MAYRGLYPISKEKSIGSYENNILSEEENEEYAGNKVKHGLFSLSEDLTLKDSTIRKHDDDNEMVEPKTPNTYHINTDVNHVINERLDVWYGNSASETLQPETMVCYRNDNCHLMDEKHNFDETRICRFLFSDKDESTVNKFNSKLSFDIIKGVMQRRFESDADVDNYKEGEIIMEEEESPLKKINMNVLPILSNNDDIIVENICNKRMTTQEIVAQQEFENGMLQMGTSGSWFHHGLLPPSVDNNSIPQSKDDRNNLNSSDQAVLDESNSQFPDLKYFSEEHNINRNFSKLPFNYILDGTPDKEEANKEACNFLQYDQVTCKRNHFLLHSHSEFNHPSTSSRQNSFLPQVSYSGSISHRTDSSIKSECSFTFPILQAEWNSSPVRMPRAERGDHSRQHRIWRIGFPCCKF